MSRSRPRALKWLNEVTHAHDLLQRILEAREYVSWGVKARYRNPLRFTAIPSHLKDKLLR